MSIRSCLCLVLIMGCTGDPGATGLPTPVVPSPVPTVVPSPVPTQTQSLRVVGYNVESGDAEAATIAGFMADVRGEAIWGFSECANAAWLNAFAVAAADEGSGQSFDQILGTTGFSDRLGILYDPAVVAYVEHEELHTINIGGSVRAPLVATFDLVGTEVRFKFMVNHLYRTDDAARHQQAQLLNTWVANESLPVIAVGDYNFDWDVQNGEADHDLGYDNMVRDDLWLWERPAELIRTQCSPSYDGVLDFVFTGNEAQDWNGVGDILFRQNAYCSDNAQQPDHRPVDAVFEIPIP